MQRREFLRATTAAALLASGASAALEVVDVATAGAAAAARRYRETKDGKVLVSDDGGRRWEVLTEFGRAYDVQRVTETDERVSAHLVYGRFGSFNLTLLKDGRTWRLA